MTAAPIPTHWTTADEALVAVEALLADVLGFQHNLRTLLAVDPDRLQIDAALGLRMQVDQLADIAAALHPLGHSEAPFVAEALLEEARRSTALRQLLKKQLPTGVATALDELPVPKVDARARWRAGTPSIPARYRQAHPLRAPQLAVRRGLRGLVRGASTDQLFAICTQVVGRVRDTRKTLEAAVLKVLSDMGEVDGIVWMVDPDGHALLNLLLRHGGELPLARLSTRWGRRFDSLEEDHFGALAGLESLGLVFVGRDKAAADLRVVVPPDVRRALSTAPRPEAGHMVLDVHIDHIEPPIWRRLVLPRSATFADLHFAIQGGFGWDNAHLFEFFTDDPRADGPIAGIPSRDAFGPEAPDARRVAVAPWLAKVGDSIGYLYDFGDSWSHTIKLVELSDTPMRGQRQLLDGDRSCPPEDCGGPPGYQMCIDALAGRGQDLTLLDRLEWLDGWKPDGFKLDKARAVFDV